MYGDPLSRIPAALALAECSVLTPHWESVNTVPKIGWEFLAWSSAPRACNVPSCRRQLRSGYVRVDNVDPTAAGFVFICTEDYFKIMAGVDPDPDAAVPAWEQANREERLQEVLTREKGQA